MTQLNKILTFIIYFLYTLNIYAQKEGNIWYFGQNAGLDFNTSSPSVLTNGSLSTAEGCASIADGTGNLLFYTDGIQVWNRTHQVMPNGLGLKGDPSSTQSAIIVPKPHSLDLYYIFTVDANAGTDGLQYSVLDMNLDGGMGDIISKNNLLFTPSTEKITAVNHANGTDIWIIGHEWNSAKFYAYLLTANGINPNPIITDIGIIHDGSSFNSHGYLKASPEGNKIVAAIGIKGLAEVFDFDNNTGVLSNPLDLTGLNYVYGVEFSQDGAYLYLTRRYYGNLYQYNLKAGSNSDILNSQFIISSNNLGGLQMAPDGKIYIAKYNNHLDVINNPNEQGVNCNYQADAIYLAGMSSTLGLPIFNQSFFIGSQLPTELLSFEANRSNEKEVFLTWTTAIEKNNAGFEIEMSKDGRSFEKLGFVEGAGNSSSVISYRFLMNNSSAGYYRLKQIDFDGEFEYSDIRYVKGIKTNLSLQIYPNPSQGEIRLYIPNHNKEIQLQVFNLQGKQVLNLESTQDILNKRLNNILPNLSKGLYIFQIRTENKVWTERIILN